MFTLLSPWMATAVVSARPAGAAGHKAALFVLSTDFAWNFAWYMLNQLSLDRGPATPYPGAKCPGGITDNCWASGNGGEIDFLESPWTVDAGAADDYRHLYSTTWNQVGRCFVPSGGKSGHASGGWFDGKAGQSTNYFMGTDPAKYPDTPEPFIWAAVVDKAGTFIYRIPAADAPTIWPGLAQKGAAETLAAAPKPPANSAPPCDDSGYCAIFLPNCQTDVEGVNKAGCGDGKSCAYNEGCIFNGEQGFGPGWFQTMFTETGQPRWPADGKPAVVNNQHPAPPVTMPWNEEMEAVLEPW